MPGLSFLSKKSWHTSNISNQEKVWIAEQKAESESRRTKELLDQIKAEREGEEFDKLTGRKHNNGVSGDRGTNWMYEGGTKSGAADGFNEVQAEEEARKNEAYLLGKEYVPEGSIRNTGDFALASTMTGALEKASTYGATIGAGYNNDGNGGAVATAAAAVGGGDCTTLRIQDAPSDAAPVKNKSSNINDLDNTHHEWNKEFHLRHEDPMFAVHQRRMAQEKDVQKKKRLMERAGLDVQILRRGEGEGEMPTYSTTAGGLAKEGSSKRAGGNGDISRHDDAKGDPSNDRHARRRLRSSSRRHHHHDDRRMEKRRKRSRRSRDDERDRRYRRHHRSRSTSPSSSSSSYSSSSYSSDSSASSRSDSRSSHHRSRRSSKKDDRKSTRQNHRRHRDRSDSDSPPQSDRYHGERSRRRDDERVHDEGRDSRAIHSSDEHRATLATTMGNRSNSGRRKSDEHRHHRSRDEYNNYADNSDNGGRKEAASAARTAHHDHANINNDNNATVAGNGKQGYGLVGTTLPPSTSNSQQHHRKEPSQEGRDQHHHRRDYLGPDRQLLESKRAELERVRQTRLNQRR